MRYVSVNYNYSPDYTTPDSWFKRTECYAGILECLSRDNEVINVKQINFEGNCIHNGIDYRFENFGRKNTLFPVRLNRYVKRLAPDVVIIQGLHRPLQMIQLGLLLGEKTKIIVHHHAEVPFTGWKRYIQKAADRFAQAYLFASHQMGLEWVKKGIISSPAKIHEVMEVSSLFHPIEKEAAKVKTGVSGRSVFLWVGRLNNNKDPLTVVKAFLQHAAFNKDARLYMIYHTGELLPQIKRLLKHARAGSKVILVGKVEHDELGYWYNSADFFISGSHYEGSGTALCEAMSCGCIPLVTDIASFRMITDDGDCGWLYEPGNEEELLWALEETKRPGLQAKQTRVLAYFKSNLSFEAIAQRISTISESLG
jgi:glycosyltransferase involved in cell wall biosynthesis